MFTPHGLRSGTALVLALALALCAAAAGQDPLQASRREPARVQPVSWDAWLTAKANAEKRDAEGDFVAALQYYLEYVRQAQGLNTPARVAWGKNNAAYMIIKLYRRDPTTDLGPARKLLEEALAIPEAPETCRACAAQNLEYVKTVVGAPR